MSAEPTAASTSGQREHVSAFQRARILAATREVCAEGGVSGVTVAKVVQRAGVSRRTFYELFVNCESCLIAAVEEGLRLVSTAVLPAWQGPAPWRKRIRAALVELLTFLDDDPVTARFVVVESLAAGPRALRCRRRVLAHAIAAVEQGRAEVGPGAGPPPLTAEGVVGAVGSVIQRRLLEGNDEPLVELTGPLMSMVVLPYLGSRAARRELELPVLRLKGNGGRALTDAPPLAELSIRITYRTLRVLSTIAAEPGASNRSIGRAAGIEDPGQISRLLARLQLAGLVQNGNSQAKPRGEPNAWSLTGRGEQVIQSLAPGSP